MDTLIRQNGRLLDLVDDEWRKEKLPNDDIAVPQLDLPEIENGTMGKNLISFDLFLTELVNQTERQTKHRNGNTVV